MLGSGHRVLLINSAVASNQVEWDFYYYYAQSAKRVADLQPPLDPFRGPLYPLVLAGLRAVAPFVSTFAVAKAVSAASGASAILLVYLIGEAILGPAWGIAAAAGAAVTSPFLVHGFLVGTDAFFACLELAAVWLLIRAPTTGMRDAALAGVLSGLALSARWNAAFLPIVAVASLALARSRLIVPFVAAFAVTATPWLVLNARLHGGNPFFNAYGRDTFALFAGSERVESLGALIRAAPLRFVGRWAEYVVENAGRVARVAPAFTALAAPGLALLVASGRQRPECWTPVIALAGLFAVNALGPPVVRQYLAAVALLLVAAAATLRWAARGATRPPRALVLAWALASGWALALAVRDVGAIRAEETALRPTLEVVHTKLPLPIAGDWNGDGRDEVGIARDGQGGKVFYGFLGPSAGPAKWVASFGPIGTPLAGRWTRGSADGIGVFVAGTFYLGNAFASGVEDRTVVFGDMNDTPLAGDWDGDGVDTVGTFRDGIFTLTDRMAPPFTARRLAFGGPGDLPVVGDWDGDGRDTVGVYRDGVFSLTNRTAPPWDDVWQVRIPVQGGVPLAGDWDGDGRDEPAVFTLDGTFHFPDRSWRAALELHRITDLPVPGE